MIFTTKGKRTFGIREKSHEQKWILNEFSKATSAEFDKKEHCFSFARIDIE
jgi:hypothetical protein